MKKPQYYLLAVLLTTGCEVYNGAPRATVEGAVNGVLQDNKTPLVIVFDKPVQTETVKLSVARLKLDAEGRLGDEDEDAATELDPIFAYDGASGMKPEGGFQEWSEDRTRFTIYPQKPLPLAEKLVVVLEPGLANDAGEAYIARERVPFSYEVKLSCVPAPDFKTGPYFFVADVVKPFAVQVQLLVYIDVDAETGKLTASLVNADRNRDASRCAPFGLTCDSTEACRTLPAPACVPPSEKAASVDEYPDYLPNYEPPTGFSFEAKGCVDGSGDKIVFVNVPVDVSVQSPPVSLTGTVLNASFELDDKGVLRGAGSISTEKVFLGVGSTTDSGKAEGTLTARSIPPGEEPPGLKHPEPPQ